jgi:choline/carnitine/betaine transport
MREDPDSVTSGSGPNRDAGIDKVVLGVSGLLAIGFIVWGFINTASLGSVSGDALAWVMTNTGWAFVLFASLFVVFALWLAMSRYGKIPLGADNEGPEFRTISWVAMMFSAGMGIGLMFYGVAEPLAHYIAPPPGTVEAESSDAVRTAMATTLFHWTLHPWAIYAVVGLSIAYASYRRRRPQLISATFVPLLGRHATGPAGRIIDILAIFATLFGSAASLGLGALQIGSGMQGQGWIESAGTTLLVVIIAVLTICFVASAVSGVARGIQWLSNINMVLAISLALFVFVVGPTVFILDLLPTALGSYAQQAAEMASRTDASGTEEMKAWLSGWTIFYWAWWISWTPFVGMFIARISRGRTIRQFVAGVLLVPSVVSLVWFAVFGGAAIQAQRDGAALGDLAFEGQLYGLLEQYPLESITSAVVMLLVAIFFVSGADAASLVMGTLAEHGNSEPRRPTVVFYGLLTGAVAAVMLVLGDGEADALTGLQNITIVAALPFVLVMAGMCVALVKDLKTDPMILRDKRAAEIMDSAVLAGTSQHGDDLQLVVERRDKNPTTDSTPSSGGVTSTGVPPAREQ